MSADGHIISMKMFIIDIIVHRFFHHFKIGLRPLVSDIKAVAITFVSISHIRMCLIPFVECICMRVVGIGTVAQRTENIAKT